MRKKMVCQYHGEVDFVSYRPRSNSDKTYWRCAECKNTNQKERLRKAKIRAVEYLGEKCSHCGKSYFGHPEVFDFHHKDIKDKEKDPAKFLGNSWENVVIEINKCVLLCANCHRIEHFEQKV